MLFGFSIENLDLYFKQINQFIQNCAALVYEFRNLEIYYCDMANIGYLYGNFMFVFVNCH